jgi:mono/diheme cytochrome c family protein
MKDNSHFSKGMLRATMVFSVMFATTLWAADKGGPKQPPKASAFLGDAAKGAEKYKMLCVTCHGEKGDGNGPAGANLTPKPGNFTDTKRSAELTDEYVYEIIKEGGLSKNRSPLMMAWKTSLTEDELKDVTAYVRAFAKAPAKKGK